MNEKESEIRIKDVRLGMNDIKFLEAEEPHQHEFSFTDLVDCKQLQDLMNNFYELVGYGVGIIDNTNTVLVATGWQDVCTKFHRVHPETCKKCTESDNYITQMRQPHEPVEYKCQNGLWDIAYPIIIDGKILAGVYFGQFFYDDEIIDYPFFEKQAEHYNFNKLEYINSLKKVPVVSRKKVKSLISYYAKLAQLVADLGYKNLIIKREQIQERSNNHQKLTESEKKFESFVKHSPDIIYKYSNKRGGLFWSERVKDILGFSPDEIKDNPFLWNNSIHPDDKPAVDKAVEDHQKGETYNIEYRIKTKTGQWIWLHDFFMHKTEIGDEIIIEGHASDITTQKNAELALKESEEHLKLITDNLPVLINHVSRDLKYLFINKTYSNIFGIAQEKIAGKNIIDVIGREAFERSEIYFDRLFKGETIKFENKITDKKNKERFVQLQLIPQFTNNIVTGFYTLGIDITERKLTEKALAELQDKLSMTLVEQNIILENSPMGISKIINRKQVWVNNEMKKMFGYTKEEMIDETTRMLYTSDEAYNKLGSEAYTALSTGTSFETMQELICKDGKHKFVRYCGKAIAPPDMSQGTIWLLEDITEKLKIEKELKESKMHLQSIFSSMNDLVFVLNKDGIFTDYNNPIDNPELYAPPELFLNNHYNQILPPELVTQLDKAIQNVKDTNTTQQFDYNLPIGNTIQWYNAKISFLKNAIGEFAGVTTVIRNVTESKQAVQALKEREIQLKKLNADKDRFISILAHDLKSPFNSLIGLSDLLMQNINKYDLNKIKKFVDLINKSAKSNFSLLEDVLMWVRAQSGKLPFEPQIHNFADICNDIISTLSLTAKNKNITIKHFATEYVDIFADKNMIKTILRNLLSNAIKFTNHGGTINIYAIANKTDATITVSDNGVGIATEITSKLFDITQKISTEGTDNETGTGLGLLLCKEFVEKHGGKIWVESQVGKGSDFTFTMPLGVN